MFSLFLVELELRDLFESEVIYVLGSAAELRFLLDRFSLVIKVSNCSTSDVSCYIKAAFAGDLGFEELLAGDFRFDPLLGDLRFEALLGDLRFEVLLGDLRFEKEAAGELMVEKEFAGDLRVPEVFSLEL